MKKLIAVNMIMLCMVTVAHAEGVDGVTIDLTDLVIAVVGLVFNLVIGIIATKVVPAVREWLEARTTTEQQVLIDEVIRKAVYAAEQIIGGGNGAEKLQYVKDVLNTAGYDIDIVDIEAAVKEMNDNALKQILDEPVEPVEKISTTE